MTVPRVLFLSHEFPPEGGGAGVNLAHLSNALVQAGVAVSIWAGRGNRETDSENQAESHGQKTSVSPSLQAHASEIPPSLRLTWIHTGKRNRYQTSLSVHLRFILGCGWQSTPLDKPDIICANMAWPAGLAALRLSRRWQIPLMVWHHGSDVHGGKAKGAGWLQRQALKWLWRHCDLALFVSDSLRLTAATYGRLPRSATVPSMVDPDLVTAAQELTHKASSPLSVLVPTHDRAYALFLGRFEAVKEAHLAVQAMLHLRQNGSALRLRMIGQGSQGERLRRLVKKWRLENCISIEEPVTHDQLPSLFAGALALVLPSRAEGMSVTVLEASVFGLPTVAAAAPGLREAVHDNETGLLFTPGDAADLARQLTKLVDQPGLRHRLGINARQKSQRYTPQAAANAFLLAADAWLGNVNAKTLAEVTP